MKLIDPFEFRDMFQQVRSIAVVGNAPSVLRWSNGAVIDAHDMVVRFNRARTAGFEEHIGSRTDVLFVNAANSLQKALPPEELCRPRCMVCFVAPQVSRSFDVEPFREWAGSTPMLVSFGPDLIDLPALPRSKPLTSGTYALFVLVNLFAVQRLFVTGFTMFGSVPGGAGKYWSEPIPSAAAAHDLDQEAKLFTVLLQRFPGELAVSDEVRLLLSQNGFELRAAKTTNGMLRRPLRKFIAAGLAWRFLHIGMILRRVAESN